jgi:hypothetical protein
MTMNLTPYAITIIAIGALICLAGWQLFRISIKTIGFILGASMGYGIGVLGLKLLNIPFNPSFEPWIPILSALFVGLIGIIFIKTLVKSILFIAGLFLGLVVYSVFAGMAKGIVYPFGIELIIKHISIWAIVSGVVFGVLFVLFEKWFVILYTSAVGAYLIMSQIQGSGLLFYGMIAVGTVTQICISRNSKMKEMQATNGTAGG